MLKNTDEILEHNKKKLMLTLKTYNYFTAYEIPPCRFNPF